MPIVGRRDLLRRASQTGVALLAAPFIQRGRCRLSAASGREYSTRAISAVERSIVVDMLSLPTLDWKRLSQWFSLEEPFSNEEFLKLRLSGITTFHPAVGFGGQDRTAASAGWLAQWRAFVRQYPQYFVGVNSTHDILRAKVEGKIGIVLGLQDSEHFCNLSDVAAYYDKGQRVSQLTYNSRNALGCGCVDRPDSGLTPYGAAIITAMNRAGMAVDISHSSDRTSLEACETSRKPVLITHSNCRALSGHPRCKTDHVIRKMALTGGVMGLTGISAFVGRGATLDAVVDHYDHVARLVGVEHVGLGSDTDLAGRPNQLDVRGLNHPLRVFHLAEALLRRGYSEQHLELILGGNFVRALSSSWA